MRFTQPINEDVVPYTTIKVDGCSDTTIGFQLLSEQPSISKRRYCNKVLVHECVSVPEIDPLALERVEFFATSDPCYHFFEIFKSSEEIDADPDPIAPTVELQLDDDDLVIGVLVNFTAQETCSVNMRLAYRMYGYPEDGPRVLLAAGNLFVTPCCKEEDCGNEIWTDVNW